MNWTELYFKMQAIGKIVDAAVCLVGFGAICFIVFLPTLVDLWSEKHGKK